MKIVIQDLDSEREPELFRAVAMAWANPKAVISLIGLDPPRVLQEMPEAESRAVARGGAAAAVVTEKAEESPRPVPETAARKPAPAPAAKKRDYTGVNTMRKLVAMLQKEAPAVTAVELVAEVARIRDQDGAPAFLAPIASEDVSVRVLNACEMMGISTGES